MMPVTENAPLSFIWPELPAATKPSAEKKNTRIRTPAQAAEIALKAEKEKPALQRATGADRQQEAWKKTAKTIGAGAAIVGSALWLTGHFSAEHYNGLMMKPGTPLASGYGYKNSRDGWVTARNIGIALFTGGAAGFAVTLVF